MTRTLSAYRLAPRLAVIALLALIGLAACSSGDDKPPPSTATATHTITPSPTIPPEWTPTGGAGPAITPPPPGVTYTPTELGAQWTATYIALTEDAADRATVFAPTYAAQTATLGATPRTDAGDESAPGLDLSTYTPGVFPQDGLTVISHRIDWRAGTAYIYAQVRNDSPNALGRLDVWVDPLDRDGYLLGERVKIDSLFTDIPPGETFSIGREFSAPETFADAALWIRYEISPSGFSAFFDLPVTVEDPVPGENVALQVSGTVTNDTILDLPFLAIGVALLDNSGQIVGFAYAFPDSGGNPVLAGDSTGFTAEFPSLPVAVDVVDQVQVLAAGYAMP